MCANLCPQAMFAPKKLRHAAAVGVARNLLMGLQDHGWHLHASASRGQGSADADGAQAEVVRECAGLLAGLGCERSLTSDRKEAVAVREWLQPCVADLLEAVADLEVSDLGEWLSWAGAPGLGWSACTRPQHASGHMHCLGLC
jgi:hypothetical protein